MKRRMKIVDYLDASNEEFEDFTKKCKERLLIVVYNGSDTTWTGRKNKKQKQRKQKWEEK